jgi:hypothetical protein
LPNYNAYDSQDNNYHIKNVPTLSEVKLPVSDNFNEEFSRKNGSEYIIEAIQHLNRAFFHSLPLNSKHDSIC